MFFSVIQYFKCLSDTAVFSFKKYVETDHTKVYFTNIQNNTIQCQCACRNKSRNLIYTHAITGCFDLSHSPEMK